MTDAALRRLPSVDEVLRHPEAASGIGRFGRQAMLGAVRALLAEAREAVMRGEAAPEAAALAEAAAAQLAAVKPSLRPVLNLTGTVLHTNLGRARIAEVAAQAALQAMREAVALEFDLETGQRGERDDHLRRLLCELTGAEDATIVNNNAAAVLLMLNTFAEDREAVVSRGELIEIGGAFRMPDIMARAGAKLVEVGTTNRTHLKDYARAIHAETGIVLKVHTSNYRIHGFTAAVPSHGLVALTREWGVVLGEDLGSGTLVDLARWGLAHEPTVAEVVASGVDLVTFSGDKLLGGPQAGFIVGRKDLIAQINRNPLKRALRVDKIRLACLEATLGLYRDPDRLAETLPTLRLLARPLAEIEAVVARLLPVVAKSLGEAFTVEPASCRSQIGSGALPVETIPSAGLAIATRSGASPAGLAAAFRRLPVPVIGRIEKNALILDFRCLEDEAGFIANLTGFMP